MNSPKTPAKNPSPNPDLAAQLNHLGLLVTAQGLDDLLAALDSAWSPPTAGRRLPAPKPKTGSPHLERRLTQARLGRFKPLAISIGTAQEDDRPLNRARPHPGFLASAAIPGVRHERTGQNSNCQNIAPCRRARRPLGSLSHRRRPARRSRWRFPRLTVAVSSASTPAPPCWSLTNVDICLTTPTPPTCSSK